MGLLPHDDILKLHAAVISAQLIGSRSALLAGIDRNFVAGLPEAENRADQILQDLDAMNETGKLANGSIPLATWLANAIGRTRGKRDEAIFAEALERVRPGGTAASTSASSRAPAARREGTPPAAPSRAAATAAGGPASPLQSTFLSYGGPDTDFARKLNDALLKNGVTTFFFAKDAIPGKKLHRLMRDGVNTHDRVILVCSKASLDRPGVVNEITETLQREARDGGKEYLIPITLDDHVFSGWKPDDPGVAQAIRDRVVADFRGADTDKGVFDAGVLKLIGALKT